MIPQFLVDEHLARAIQKQSGVLHPGMVVRLIGDEGAPERGTPDPEILIWLERHNYILVTKQPQNHASAFSRSSRRRQTRSGYPLLSTSSHYWGHPGRVGAHLGSLRCGGVLRLPHISAAIARKERENGCEKTTLTSLMKIPSKSRDVASVSSGCWRIISKARTSATFGNATEPWNWMKSTPPSSTTSRTRRR